MNEGIQVDCRDSRRPQRIYIRKIDKPPALENDGAVLKFIRDGERYSPQNDQDLRKVLRLFVSKRNFKFTVFIETPVRRHQNLSQIGISLKCVNSTALVMTRILV